MKCIQHKAIHVIIKKKRQIKGVGSASQLHLEYEIKHAALLPTLCCLNFFLFPPAETFRMHAEKKEHSNCILNAKNYIQRTTSAQCFHVAEVLQLVSPFSARPGLLLKRSYIWSSPTQIYCFDSPHSAFSISFQQAGQSAR